MASIAVLMIDNPHWADLGAFAFAAATFTGAVILGVVKGWQSCTRKWLSRKLFALECRKGLDKDGCSIELAVSEEVQNIEITLTAALQTTVSFVSCRFKGDGTAPEIKWLYDWEQGEGSYPPDIFPPYKLKDGRWYWKYKSSWQRERGARITIGIGTITNAPFRGRLIVAMTTVSNGAKDHSIAVATTATLEVPHAQT